MNLPIIASERLTLRPYEIEDAPAVSAAVQVSRAEFAYWFPWALESTPATIAENAAKAQDAMTAGEAAHFVVLLGESLIGRVSVEDIDRTRREGELGYWLHAAYHGRGCMTEAVRAILPFALGSFGLDRVFAYTHNANASSQRVLTKCGFVLAASAPGAALSKPERPDYALFVREAAP